MSIPDPILIRKKPVAIKCPSCSETFDISTYEGGSGSEKVDRMAEDFETHFKNTHADQNSP